MPASRRVGVKKVLAERVNKGEITAEDYKRITGDDYDAHNEAANAHGDIRASAAAMNASIKAIELKFGTNVTKNPFSATFSSLDGLTVAGVWNADLARIEF